MKTKQLTNADMPASAIEFNGFGQCAPEAHLGLTKREMFAMHAMQVLSGSVSYKSTGRVAQEAVKLADALLEELEK